MAGKKVITEIIDMDELPEGLRRSLMISPEHFITSGGSVYVLQGQKVVIIPDSQEAEKS